MRQCGSLVSLLLSAASKGCNRISKPHNHKKSKEMQLHSQLQYYSGLLTQE